MYIYIYKTRHRHITIFLRRISVTPHPRHTLFLSLNSLWRCGCTVYRYTNRAKSLTLFQKPRNFKRLFHSNTFYRYEKSKEKTFLDFPELKRDFSRLLANHFALPGELPNEKLKRTRFLDSAEVNATERIKRVLTVVARERSKKRKIKKNTTTDILLQWRSSMSNRAARGYRNAIFGRCYDVFRDQPF